MTRRNYSIEIRDKVRAMVPEWHYVPSVVAQNVIDDLEENDPELLLGFLREWAVPVLTDLIEDITRDNPTAINRERMAQSIRRYEKQMKGSEPSQPSQDAAYRKSCQDKARHKTAHAALQQVKKAEPEQLHAYKCEFCGDWHVGHAET
jgi:hypothetical protein